MTIKATLENLTSQIQSIRAPLSAVPPKVRVPALENLRFHAQLALDFANAIEFASAVPRLGGRGPVGPVAVATLAIRFRDCADDECALTGDTVATTRLVWLRLTDGTIPTDHPVRAEIVEQFGEPGEVAL